MSYFFVNILLLHYSAHYHFPLLIAPEKQFIIKVKVNGYIRDTFQITDIPVALYALGTCSRKAIPVTSGERGVRLSFGGIEFNQGDYLYADTDGVIVTANKIV